MKKITILGSTGSIGLNSLKVIELNPEKYRVVALSAGRNIDLLEKQIEKFNPLYVATLDEGLAETLRGLLKKNPRPHVLSGIEGLNHLATLEEVDTVISAISGAAGLIPTYAAIKAGKNIALANKETMVMAGPLVMDQAKKQGVTIMPIDSEHSAIFQSLEGHPREDLKRVILTASGGPFKDLSIEEMESASPAQALKHPNWNMGQKISIDSASLMNKGLEAIEAKWLFDLKIDQISIFIHPQSIIHSMVEYNDGSIIAQLGIPDMITPISYALSYPRHVKTHLPSLDLDGIEMLTFERPDTERFQCLDLAMKAVETGDSMPAVLNGANEVAVYSFLRGEIGFLQIPVLVEKTMEAHRPFTIDSIESVMEADLWAQDKAKKILNQF
ncbi:MAG: 1-deoxy-D-xylulose-5-phosphate reductoisomerase [Thermodesulfobacteriota bacterium]|nr:1-deoxy-D-xylulose-5-phosphate reductoisomerase [Thermodesulfobacteriota bacterium]